MDSKIINLTGFNYTGKDVLGNLTTLYAPVVDHVDADGAWFQQQLVIAMINGQEITDIVRGLNRFATLAGFTVQGGENLGKVAA